MKYIAELIISTTSYEKQSISVEADTKIEALLKVRNQYEEGLVSNEDFESVGELENSIVSIEVQSNV